MRLDAEAAQDRLRAMVAGAHGDALLVERRADVFGAEAVEHERDDARLLRGRADRGAGRGRVAATSVAVAQQLVLVAARRCSMPIAIHVVERGAEAHGVGDVAGAGLEARRRPLVRRLLERDVGDHVAAALPGRHSSSSSALP